MTKKEELINEIEHHELTLMTIEELFTGEINRRTWYISKEDILDILEEYFDDNLYSEEYETTILRWQFIDLTLQD